jgi:hypothetical protein
MRNFPLYDLNNQEFEKLVALICERILGTGIINFSTGPDGGRDGKFTGKAQNFPSKTSPWEGKFIIQAKHTEKPNAKCSDYDFKKILKEEVNQRLKKLIENNELDYYLLFTNRRLSGTTDAKITDFIESKLHIENCLIGDEKIQLWLKQYPEIAKVLDLNKLFIPFEFYEKDLKEVIVKFSEQKDNIGKTIKRKQDQLKYIDKTVKNELNNLSKEYFEFIKRNSLAYFHKIETFLKDPINKKYKTFYDNTVLDLNETVIVRRDEYHKFDEVLKEIYDYVMTHNFRELKEKRKLVRVFLHYMYWNCDIGIED